MFLVLSIIRGLMDNSGWVLTCFVHYQRSYGQFGDECYLFCSLSAVLWTIKDDIIIVLSIRKIHSDLTSLIFFIQLT